MNINNENTPFLKASAEKFKIDGASLIKKYEKTLNEIISEISEIKKNALEDHNVLLALLLEKFGRIKTKKIIKNLDINVLHYMYEVYNLEQGRLLYKVLNEVKELSYERIIDLIKTLHQLQLKDKDGFNILSKAATLLKGPDKLIFAIDTQNNYINEILYNRPHFDLQSKIRSIIHASKTSDGTHIIKYGNLFLNTEKDGNIYAQSNKGGGESKAMGLFTGDMQFIDQYELKIFNAYNLKLPHKLNYSTCDGYTSSDENIYNNLVFTNRKRIINGGLFEKLEINNKSHTPVKVCLVLSSIIKDIFEIRGKFTTSHNPPDIQFDCNGDVILNNFFESKNIYGVRINVRTEENILIPHSVDYDTGQIIYKIGLLGNSNIKLSLKIQPLLNNLPFVDGETITDPANSFEEAENLIENAQKTKFAKIKINGNIPNIQKTLDKCHKDLNMLVSYINVDGKTYSYIDAGLPRYSALFGRDSIITALEVFPLNEDIARDTLELLAIFQGKSFENRYKTELEQIKNSLWAESVKNAAIKGINLYYLQKEEQFGKILHELRVGELANTGDIPHSPYYGTVDATPLWIILYAEYFKWSNDRDFLQKLLPNAEAALEWIESNIINGYLRFKEYFQSKINIRNQGWKDAGNSIKHVVNLKGYLSDPEYPIALAEVQGYVYKAYSLMSQIYKELDQNNKSETFAKKAEYLKLKFNRDFWIENEQFYTMALDNKNNPIINVTSNIGHCLAMGIIDTNKSEIVEERLLSEDMFSGWGIRTLSSKNPAYDPLSYHNGSVWVHDSAFTATGFTKKSMATLTKVLFEAANMFDDNRLPELFSGFPRCEGDLFIQEYPEACSPQAWASGSLFWLLIKLTGLKSKNQEIILENPYIPEWIKSISIEGIHINNKIINIENIENIENLLI